MAEKWRDLAGIVANGEKYKVSDLGNVWSCKSRRLLTPAKTRNGYLFVSFSKRGCADVKSHRIHRLVALAFIENNDPTRDEVNHLDGDKENNCLTNLEWATPSENRKHAYSTGLRKPLPSTNMLKATESSCRPVIMSEQSSDKILGVYQSANEVERRGHFSKRTTITYQCRNKSMSTKNPFYFRYATDEQVAKAKEDGNYYENPIFAKEESQ